MTAHGLYDLYYSFHLSSNQRIIASKRSTSQVALPYRCCVTISE
jgi:hypothetical protein